jgi:hypothetical protein
VLSDSFEWLVNAGFPGVLRSSESAFARPLASFLSMGFKRN